MGQGADVAIEDRRVKTFRRTVNIREIDQTSILNPSIQSASF